MPLATLPFREPLTFTIGPAAGQEVPAQNGLLASYFAGAAYERLDHQQVDPEVNFLWDAITDGPVLAPDAVDTDEGCGGFCGLPPFWHIWSVVWEGYLEAPADGTYTLALHVNNGGWLEMKDATGALRIVVNAPGGPGFEGTVMATVDLTSGRHYLRISFFQNGPPTGVAQLLWQPPGAQGLEVIPSSNLFTQLTPPRAFIFVHGIAGDFTAPGFAQLLQPLSDRYGKARVVVFRYSEDKGSRNPGTGVCDRIELPADFDPTTNLPITAPTGAAICDSNDSVGVNAVLLDSEVRRARAQLGAERVTIVANSMGGAITRAFLAYATRSRTGSLALVDEIVFLQGAQQGSYLARFAEFVDEKPILEPLSTQIESAVRERVGIDRDRPAFTDLTPQSSLYQAVNRAEHVPDSIHYLNVASDIRIHTVVPFLPWRVPTIEIQIGDTVLLPGLDQPDAIPPLGGARFLASTIDKGKSSGQWLLRKDLFIFGDPFTFAGALNELLTTAEAHPNLGAKMREICVETSSGARHLDRALLEGLFDLDDMAAPPRHLGFGNRRNTGCLFVP